MPAGQPRATSCTRSCRTNSSTLWKREAHSARRDVAVRLSRRAVHAAVVVGRRAWTDYYGRSHQPAGGGCGRPSSFLANGPSPTSTRSSRAPRALERRGWPARRRGSTRSTSTARSSTIRKGHCSGACSTFPSEDATDKRGHNLDEVIARVVTRATTDRTRDSRPPIS